MSELLLSDAGVVRWVVIPGLILVARTLDMSIDTIRVILLSRGNRVIAPLLGFFEILIWLLAIGQIFRNLGNPACYVAYAGGFALGNFLGMVIESRLRLGEEVLRITTRRNATALEGALRDRGIGYTVFDGQGARGPVSTILVVLERRDLPEVLKLVAKHNPRAFYSIEDVRSVAAGIFPRRASRRGILPISWRTCRAR
jgi:uncharacterized protein YebE (UPF0316 family)